MSRTHTAPLAPYLLNARQGPNFPAPNRSTTILNWSQNSNSNSNSTPMLRSDRLNGVILFAGCFNPPHRGHFQVLRHAMQQCGPNLNLIAAVVSLKTDQTLAQKLCEGRYAEADGLVFGLEDRKMQWRGNVSTTTNSTNGGRNSSASGSGHPPLWLWVYDGQNTRDCWAGFQARVDAAVQRDGFKIRWVALYGRDYAGQCDANWIPRRDSYDLVVCGKTERPENVRPNGCTEWVDDVVNADAVKRHVERNKVVWRAAPWEEERNGPNTSINLEKFMERREAVKVSHVLGSPNCTLRFLPMTKVARSTPRTTLGVMSSTHVRKVLRAYYFRDAGSERQRGDDEAALKRRLMADLRESVMFPEILVEAVKRARLARDVMSRWRQDWSRGWGGNGGMQW